MIALVTIYAALHTWQTIGVVKGTAPDFSAHLISGEQIQLRDYQSRPVLLHFWAPWCPVCRLENPSVASLAEDAQVITVVVWTESVEAVNDYLQKESLQMPVVFDAQLEIAKRYNIKAVPTSLFIDAKGEIRFVEQGYTSEWGMRVRLWWLEMVE